jgi:mRNA interferase MazF
MDVVVKRFEVYLVNLDPTAGSEIKKKRPCVIVSPNEMNKYLNTIIIAPLTSVRRGYPSRIECKFKGRKGEIMLEQLRSVDKRRLIKRQGTLNEDLQNSILQKLQDIFSR